MLRGRSRRSGRGSNSASALRFSAEIAKIRNERRGYMKIVIQCSGSKAKTAGSFHHDGKPVAFVAHPELLPSTSESWFARPDDAIPGRTTTWREHLAAYNNAGTNPDRLARAGSLYSPSAYRSALNAVGSEKLYILSAGWGLVRSDYFLPRYDITFSSQADPWQRRRSRDVFHDFNQLTANESERESTSSADVIICRYTTN